MQKEQFQSLIKFFLLHRGKIIGGLIGFIFGILFLLAGFWKTLVILFCTLIGLIIGSRWDINDDIKHLLDRILPPQLK